MKMLDAVNEKDNLKGTVRVLKFFVLIIGIAIIWVGFKINSAIDKPRTILVPFGLDTKITVTGDDISDEGLELYGRIALSLRFTYSPGTARKYFTSLLRLYAPEAYPDAWKSLYDLADKVETANVTSVFYPEKLSFDRKNKQIIADGSSRKYKDNTALSVAGTRCIISYKVDRGMFQLLQMEEKEKK
jgi:type IV conjugative transfer system protein TraE